jgi:hypothetical protein
MEGGRREWLKRMQKQNEDGMLKDKEELGEREMRGETVKGEVWKGKGHWK